MKKTTIILGFVIMLSALCNKAYSQYYFYSDSYYNSDLIFEIGGSTGVMNCLTDLGGNKGIGKRFVKDLNLGYNRFNGSLFLGCIYKNAIAARLELTLGKVAANDAVLKNVPVTDIAYARFNRNLNFESSITEISFVTEIHPFFLLKDWSISETAPPRVSPYLVGGIGYFAFNPQAKYQGRLIDLQPLRTEGQGFAEYPDRKVYNLRQINFPVGFGAKYELSPNVNLRAEFMYRILNTDYLDDVSTRYIQPATFITNGFTGDQLYYASILNNQQLTPLTGVGSKRGDPTNNDGFFSFNIKFSYTFGRQRIR